MIVKKRVKIRANQHSHRGKIYFHKFSNSNSKISFFSLLPPSSPPFPLTFRYSYYGIPRWSFSAFYIECIRSQQWKRWESILRVRHGTTVEYFGIKRNSLPQFAKPSPPIHRKFRIPLVSPPSSLDLRNPYGFYWIFHI